MALPISRPVEDRRLSSPETFILDQLTTELNFALFWRWGRLKSTPTT